MEEILNQVSNPFDMDNFKRLTSMYLENESFREFYNDVVTCFQNRNMEEKNIPVYLKSDCVTVESMGHWKKTEYFSNFFPTEHRIYINSSLASSSAITQIFTDECIRQNLPFELKYAVKPHTRSDGIVIGSNTEVYKKHIDILRKIAIEHPELVQECGTPHLLTANLDGWMGLADENVGNRYRSYTENRLQIFDIAIKKYLLKHEEIGARVEGYADLKKRYEECDRAVKFYIKRGRILPDDYEKKSMMS